MKTMKLLSAIALSSAALTAGAGEWYIGVGTGVSSLAPHEGTTGGKVTEYQDTPVRGLVGYQFSERLGVEGYYADLGAAEIQVDANPANKGAIGYQVGGVHGVYRIYNSDGFAQKGQSGMSVFGKAGVGVMRNDGENVKFERLNDYHFTAGVGAEYKLSNGFGVRVDGDVYDKDAAAAYVSAMARFGGAAAPVMDLPDAMADSDADGILDNADQCPSQPGVAENFGCPMVAQVGDPIPVEYSPIEVQQDPCANPRALGRIYFALDSAKLDSSAQSALNGLADYMMQCSSAVIDLSGHTCAGASEEHNVGLSKRRSESVAAFLAQRGVSPDRLMLNWYGESQPAVPNDSPRGMQLNRRVDISVLGGL